MDDKEKYYTEVIAPKLAAIATECWEHGISILAVCEFDKAMGKTLSISPGSSFAFRFIDAAYECRGNVDNLMLAIERHARKHGHSSIYLHRLGIPDAPMDEDRISGSPARPEGGERMNNEFKVVTMVRDDGLIDQQVFAPGLIEQTDRPFVHTILATKEEHIRQALISLGWTPPGNTKPLTAAEAEGLVADVKEAVRLIAGHLDWGEDKEAEKWRLKLEEREAALIAALTGGGK